MLRYFEKLLEGSDIKINSKAKLILGQLINMAARFIDWTSDFRSLNTIEPSFSKFIMSKNMDYRHFIMEEIMKLDFDSFKELKRMLMEKYKDKIMPIKELYSILALTCVELLRKNLKK